MHSVRIGCYKKQALHYDYSIYFKSFFIQHFHLESLLSLSGNLNNSRSSDNSVIRSSSVAARKHDVALSSNALRNHDLVGTVHLSRVGEHGAGDGDEGSVNLALDLHVLERKHDLAARLNHHVRRRSGESGERLDGEGSVGLGAGLNELRGECVNLVVAQWVVEGSGEGGLADGVADVCRVAGLNGQDGAGGGEVCLGHDVRGSTQVGAHTDTLEDRSGSQEAGDVLVPKVVGARIDGLGASSGESASQELDVSFLVARDHLDAVVGLFGEVGGLEVIDGVLCERVTIEGVLEVLKSERVVENIGISGSICALVDRGSGGKCCESGDGEECGLHLDWCLDEGSKKCDGDMSR
jgi:hypothetical protein